MDLPAVQMRKALDLLSDASFRSVLPVKKWGSQDDAQVNLAFLQANNSVT